MLRKICPICEQTMTWPHYCRNCRQFIKKPYIRDITYYLNESHPEGEKNCDYHGIPGKGRQTGPAGFAAARHGSAGRRPVWENLPAQNPPVGNSPVLNQAGRGSGLTGRVIVPSVSIDRHKRSRGTGGRKAVFILVGVVLFMQIIGAAASLMGGFFISSGRSESGDYRLLTDEEVLAQGKPCNSNGHYSIGEADMGQEMETIIEAAGYEIISSDRSSWNYEDTGGGDPWTDYDTTITYGIEKTGSSQEETSLDSVTVSCDTASGQLHGLSFYLSDPRAAAVMAEEAIGFLQNQGEIPSDEDYKVLVRDEILRYSDRGSDDDDMGLQRTIPEDGEGQTEFYFYETEGDYYMTIWRMRD